MMPLNKFTILNCTIRFNIDGAYKQVDLGMTPATLSLERYESVDYTAFVSGDGYSILIKYPTPILSPSATFDVFSHTVSLYIR